MARMTTTPANQALDAFCIDQYRPFMHDPGTATGLLTEAHGLLKVLGAAYEDSGNLEGKGVESGLQTLNTGFVTSALSGIGSLIAMAMFLQEQGE